MCDLYDKREGKCHAKTCPASIDRCPEFEYELSKSAMETQQHGIFAVDGLTGEMVLVSTAS